MLGKIKITLHFIPFVDLLTPVSSYKSLFPLDEQMFFSEWGEKPEGMQRSVLPPSCGPIPRVPYLVRPDPAPSQCDS